MTKDNIQKIIYGIIILFFVVPFIFLVYINNNASSMGIDLRAYLTEDPLMTIQLISVFLLPLSAIILKSKWEDIKTKNGPNELYLSVILLMLSQFLIGNVIYGLLFTILLVFVTRHYKIQLTEVLQGLSDIRYFLTTFIGEIAIVAMSVFLQVLASRLR